jgi:hypothetical protein
MAPAPDFDRISAFGTVSARGEDATGYYEVRQARIDAAFMLAARDALQTSLAGFLHEIAQVSSWAGTDEGQRSRLSTYTVTLMQIAKTLPMTELILWSMDLWEAALSGGEAHAGFVPTERDIETPYQWWFTEQPAVFETPEELEAFSLDVPCQTEGVLVFPTRMGSAAGEEMMRRLDNHSDYGAMHRAWEQDLMTGRHGVMFGLLLQPIFPESGSTPRSVASMLPRFRLLPPILVGEPLPALNFQTDMFAVLQFLRQEYVASEAIRPSRAIRRRREREGKRDAETRIQQIVLRRRRAATAAHEAAKVDYTHQWIVSGHWRNQWYPSEGRHKPKFVGEYVKGPEGKPLKARRERVYLVKR